MAPLDMPRFIRPLPRKQKTERQKHFEKVQERKRKQDELAQMVISKGINKEMPLKSLIITLRESKLTYKWISIITGAKYGYVRNVCYQCGLTNDAI